jgi:hypothetical protein
VRGGRGVGVLTSFNIYISHVKNLHRKIKKTIDGFKIAEILFFEMFLL